MEMNFCRRCGSALKQDTTDRYTCANGHHTYMSPAIGAGVFLIDSNDQIVLAVRGIEPYKGSLDVFGGFVNSDETIEQALQRELKEELGLSANDYDKPIYLTSALNLYPYQGEDRQVVSILFYARLLVPTSSLLVADDVAGIETVSVSSSSSRTDVVAEAAAGLKALARLQITD